MDRACTDTVISTGTRKHEVSIKMQREKKQNNMTESTKGYIHILNIEIYVIIGFLILSLILF